AEIIFGAVNEPAMQGEIRVTVIATGFDRVVTGTGSSAMESQKHASQTPVIPFPNQRPLRTTVPAPRPAASEGIRRSTQQQPGATPQSTEKAQDLNDMEIPTFIRRQMD
ncbi:MAG: cell division protein FtsZ, partial [Gemmatimonadota bacterium]